MVNSISFDTFSLSVKKKKNYNDKIILFSISNA